VTRTIDAPSPAAPAPAPPSRPDPGPPAARVVDEFDPVLVNVLTVLGFAVPVVVYLWMFLHYSVNVPVGDQWDDITVIRASTHHAVPWGALWAQHNENRMFFPNLLVLALARTTSFNIHVEELLGVLLLFAAAALVILTHRRRAPDTPWLYYCPVVLVMLTLAQYGNTLWGFQVAWFLILLALAATLWFLDRPVLTWPALAAAVACAVVGSLSSSQGLLLWPVGLVLLYHRRRRWWAVVAWAAAAVATAALYLHDLDTNAGNPAPAFAGSHLLASVKFYLYAVGDVVGIPATYGKPGDNGVLVLGGILVAFSLLLLVVYGLARDDRGPRPLGLALIVMGLLFAAMVTSGRALLGYFAASASRYTTFDLLIPLGIYLTVLPPPPTLEVGATEDSRRPGRWGHLAPRRVAAWADVTLLSAVRLVIGIAIAVEVVLGTLHGLDGARRNHTYQSQAVPIARDISHYPDGIVAYHLYVFRKADFIRAQAAFARQHHLSIYAVDDPWP
jgi:hypothetical protein